MRIFCKLAIFAFLTGCVSHQFETSQPVTENRFIPEDDFLRISEFFTGKEPLTDRVFVRSNEDGRGGYYWIFPISKKMSENQPLTIQIAVQIPGNPETKEFILKTNRTLNEGQTLWTGITGSDWPEPDLSPVAWKISIRSADGKEIVTRRSFLWTADGKIDEREQ